MEIFVLSESLKTQGIKVGWGRKKHLSEVIIFQDGFLFVSTNKINYYGHKELLKQIKGSRFKETSLISASGKSPYVHIHPDEIVKTHYERDLDIVLITPFQTITEVIDPEIRFYRSLHEDAKPRVEINSLWLAIPEVNEKLEPFLIPASGTTKFTKSDLGIFHSESLNRSFRSILVGDDTLTLYMDLNEQTPQWKVDK